MLWCVDPFIHLYYYFVLFYYSSILFLSILFNLYPTPLFVILYTLSLSQTLFRPSISFILFYYYSVLFLFILFNLYPTPLFVIFIRTLSLSDFLETICFSCYIAHLLLLNGFILRRVRFPRPYNQPVLFIF